MTRLPAVTALVCALQSPALTAADLNVAIAGVRNGDGYVMVALYDSGPAYAAERRLGGAFIAAGEGRISVAFPNLRPGTYVVSTFHDENDNGNLDRNFFGVPTEGYGFSNGATGFAGPPGFAAAAVDLGAAHKQISITLNY